MNRSSQPSAVAEHLSTNILADGGGAIKLEEHVGLQQVCQVGAHPHPLVLDVVHHILLVEGVCHEVDAPQAGILVTGVEGLEAVAKALLGAVVSQAGAVVGAAAHGSVPVADQSVGHHQGDVVGVGPAAALHSDGHMGQGHAVVPHSHIGASVSENVDYCSLNSFVLI